MSIDSKSQSVAWFPTGKVRLFWLTVPEALVSAVLPPATLEGILEDEDLERYQLLRIPMRRAEFLLSRVLLRVILNRLGEGQNTPIRLHREANGKPYLACGTRRSLIHLNNSHSHGCLLWAFSRHGPLGCDVERIGPADELVAREAFEPGELAVWLTLGDKARRERFYRLWTLKEAVLKADGRGLHLPLQSFRINLPYPQEQGSPTITVVDQSNGPAPDGWQLFEFEVQPGVRGAVALGSNDPVVFRIQQLVLNQWSVEPDGCWSFVERSPTGAKDSEREFGRYVPYSSR